MNTSELEDFVQVMIDKHPDYKNRIIDLYRSCIDNIINEIQSSSYVAEIFQRDGFKNREIESCVNSIKELVNAQ